MNLERFKSIITRPRFIILIVALLLSLLSISPNFSVLFGDSEGVAIKNVLANSSASFAGMQAPGPDVPVTQYEYITEVGGKSIAGLSDYYKTVAGLQPGQIVTITTDEDVYTLQVDNETSLVEGNQTQSTDDKAIDLGLRVQERAATRIKKGLDLQGGTRVLLSPKEKVDQSTITLIKDNMERRLNVYGLSDVIVRSASDLPKVLGGSGKDFIVVEIAGATEEEIKSLVANQGKFEAVVANETVFYGGQNDITYVCRTSDCAGIDPQQGCRQIQGSDEWACSFRFTIALRTAAAERFKEATQNLSVVTVDEEGNPLPPDQHFLSSPIEFYLDNRLVDELSISSSLQGRLATDIQITGSGQGPSEQLAMQNALDNMKQMQTILVTGSLPVELEVVRTDVVSPLLGNEFLKNAILVGALALLAVISVISIRYRKASIVGPLVFSIFCELVIILGVAAFINWNIDLAAIAGIIIAIGTGVDHLIIITDETMRKQVGTGSDSWKQRIKAALFIVMAAYFTTVVAMIPLLVAGAGLLKGFALTTLIGISVGVFITRPTYAILLEELYSEE
jgi:preprotein translocase subunit SecD